MKHFRSVAAAAILSSVAGASNAFELSVPGWYGVDFENYRSDYGTFDYQAALLSAGYTGNYEVQSATLFLHMDEWHEDMNFFQQIDEWDSLAINPDGAEVVAHNIRVTDFYTDLSESLYYAFGNDPFHVTDRLTFTSTYYADSYVSDGIVWTSPTETFEYVVGSGGYNGVDYYGQQALTAESLSLLNSDGYLDYFVHSLGTWRMLSSELRLEVAEVSAVPVPAAAWLLGSGLVGLIGVARRKA